MTNWTFRPNLEALDGRVMPDGSPTSPPPVPPPTYPPPSEPPPPLPPAEWQPGWAGPRTADELRGYRLLQAQVAWIDSEHTRVVAEIARLEADKSRIQTQSDHWQAEVARQTPWRDAAKAAHDAYQPPATQEGYAEKQRLFGVWQRAEGRLEYVQDMANIQLGMLKNIDRRIALMEAYDGYLGRAKGLIQCYIYEIEQALIHTTSALPKLSVDLKHSPDLRVVGDAKWLDYTHVINEATMPDYSKVP